MGLRIDCRTGIGGVARGNLRTIRDRKHTQWYTKAIYCGKQGRTRISAALGGVTEDYYPRDQLANATRTIGWSSSWTKRY